MFNLTYKNEELPYPTCGNEEICIARGCADTKYCPKPGTFEKDFPGLSNVKVTVTCCDTDLCNIESIAKISYEKSFSFLFYICIFVFTYLTSL